MIRRWLWRRRRRRLEYHLFMLAYHGDEAANRAWYELVK